jgi:ribonuclease BN (tRNA processing enzyme)
MRLIGQRTEPTKLFAPYGLRSFLGTSISSNKSFSLREIVPSLSKRALDLSVDPVIFDRASGTYSLTRNELFSVTAVPIKHTVFCLGYIIQEAKQRGRYFVSIYARIYY